MEIPSPVDVATIIAEREPGRRYPPEGYLSRAEVARAWPAVWRFDAVISANHVRFRDVESYTTWGTIQGPREYLAEDVQRVADEIAAGTAVLEPEWRTDTTVGRSSRDEWRLADQRRRNRRQAVQAALVIILVVWPSCSPWCCCQRRTDRHAVKTFLAPGRLNGRRHST